jgi:hypothetical protein
MNKPGQSQRQCRTRRCEGLILAALLTLSGCAFRYGLVAEEQDAIQAGSQSLALLRVSCSVERNPCECFGEYGANSDGPLLAFGLGSFATAGEPRPVVTRFLSDSSRAAGWAFFVLPRGVHYLAVAGPLSGVSLRTDLAQLVQEAPRWRIDVPGDSPLIYLGSMKLAGLDAGTLMFGAKIVRPAPIGGAIEIEYEEAPARELLAAHFAPAGEMQTLPLRRWNKGDPIIIRTPVPRPGPRP